MPYAGNFLNKYIRGPATKHRRDGDDFLSVGGVEQVIAHHIVPQWTTLSLTQGQYFPLLSLSPGAHSHLIPVVRSSRLSSFTPCFSDTLSRFRRRLGLTDTFYLSWVNILGRTAFRLDWSLMDVNSEESLPNVLTAMFVCLFPFRRRTGDSSCNNVLPFISSRQEMHVYAQNIVDSLASICNLLRNY